MTLKFFKPDTPSKRGLVLIDRSSLYKGSPVKSLTKGKSSSGGRNNHGRITAYHKGGGHKRRYRIIDFKRQNFDVEGVVQRIEYDPNRSAFIALIKYEDEVLSYILAPRHLKVGDKVISGEKVDVKVGNAMLLKNIPIGTLVHNIEFKPSKGGQIARAAGSFAQILGKSQGYIQLRLKSGEIRIIFGECMATIGVLSNLDRKNIKLGKAGRNVWLGKRSVVRGVAKNPVDHPHGGGEGKTSGGRHPTNSKGKLTKGYRTRNNVATDKYIVRRRYHKSRS